MSKKDKKQVAREERVKDAKEELSAKQKQEQRLKTQAQQKAAKERLAKRMEAIAQMRQDAPRTRGAAERTKLMARCTVCPKDVQRGTDGSPCPGCGDLVHDHFACKSATLDLCWRCVMGLKCPGCDNHLGAAEKKLAPCTHCGKPSHKSCLHEHDLCADCHMNTCVDNNGVTRAEKALLDYERDPLPKLELKYLNCQAKDRKVLSLQLVESMINHLSLGTWHHPLRFENADQLRRVAKEWLSGNRYPCFVLGQCLGELVRGKERALPHFLGLHFTPTTVIVYENLPDMHPNLPYLLAALGLSEVAEIITGTHPKGSPCFVNVVDTYLRLVTRGALGETPVLEDKHLVSDVEYHARVSDLAVEPFDGPSPPQDSASVRSDRSDTSFASTV